VFVTLLVFACGGGGSAPPVDQPVDQNDGVDSGIELNQSMESDNTETPADDASDGIAAVDAAANGVFRVQTGTAEDGVNRLFLSEIDEVQANRGGYLAVDATATQSAPTDTFPNRTERVSTVWHGTLQSPALLVTAGDAIGNQPPNIRYGETSLISLRADGEVALIAESIGLEEKEFYAIGGAEGVTSYLEEGQSIAGVDGESVVIGGFRRLQHSSAGSLVYATIDGSISGALVLLVNRDQHSIEAVTGYRPDAAPLLEDGCRFSITREAFNEIPQFSISPAGVMAFGAQPFSTGTATCAATAIVRKSGGQYETLVQSGDLVPGTGITTFASVGLHSIADDDSIVFEAVLNTPTGVDDGDNRSSWWVIAPDNSMRLIALAGEEVSLGASTTNTLPVQSSAYDVVYEDGYAAIRVAFDFRTQAILFGRPHEGVQPHAAIAAPGASALQNVASSFDTGFGTFADSVFFDELSTPVISADGRVAFTSILIDASNESEVYDAIWVKPVDGALSVTADSSTTVNIDSALQTVLNFDSEIRRTGPVGEDTLGFLDDGGIVFSGKFTNDSSARGDQGVAYLKPSMP